MVEKIVITKRSKVRRNNLSYLRERSGKSARLTGKGFDRAAVNDVTVPEEPTEATPAEEIKEVPEVEVVDTPAEDKKEETKED